MKVYIDGKLYDKSQARVSVFDHGLLYGDGVFEGIRSYGGFVFQLREHIDRLYASAHAIRLKIPMPKSRMIDAVCDTLRANRLKDAYIRLVVTRGVGDLGLDPDKCDVPTVIIITDKIVLYPETVYRNGLTIVTVPTRRNVAEALSPQIKSLNYLNNILAKIEAKNAGVQEALMLDHQGYVTECTGENVFVVRGGVVCSPPTYVGVLPGITAACVRRLAAERGLETRETLLTRYDLFNADEMFITGTAAEVIPVVKVDGRRIGTGKPGPVTRQLMADFRNLTATDGVAI